MEGDYGGNGELVAAMDRRGRRKRQSKQGEEKETGSKEEEGKK